MFSRPTIKLAVVLALFGMNWGCSTTSEISSRYQSAIDAPTSGATTLVFLIDGLPVRTLKKALENGDLPNIKKFFLGDKKEFYQARPVFPSLTYPNLTSLITEMPVGQHRIYGNKVFLGGQFFDFESPSTHRFYNEHIDNKNVFHRLGQKGLKTAAIGYNFWSNTTVATNPADIEAAVKILEKDYLDVDSKLVTSLQLLLEETSPSKWPDFVFIHLIGLDFTNHDHGPDTQEAYVYLRKIDLMLETVLDILAQADQSKQRKVVALLTADHGFSLPVDKFVDLKKQLPKNLSVTVQNEGRMASILFPKHWNEEDKRKYFEKVPINSGIEFKAIRLNQQVVIEPPMAPPEIKESLLSYFQNPDHPGMVIIAAPGYGLTRSYRGFHGGTTPEEMTIPLLLRNGRLRDPSRLPYIYELLNFIQ